MISHYDGIALIKRWAELFDVHASPSIIYGYTSGEDFLIKFGDTELRGLEGLNAHHPLKEQFFDEHHLYYDFQVESAGPPLVMTTRMVWDTHRRRSDGSAEHLIADLHHRWTFIRRPADGRVVFQRHELLSLAYRDGAAPSESDPNNLHIDPRRVAFARR
ncbi:hypothetical protein [Halochromatium sp.]